MTEVQPIVKPVRTRDPGHLDNVRLGGCEVPGCTRRPVSAHHITFAQPKARGLKVGDQHTIGLCEELHHSAQSNEGVHHTGDERGWYPRHGIPDPLGAAARNYAATLALRSKP